MLLSQNIQGSFLKCNIYICSKYSEQEVMMMSKLYDMKARYIKRFLYKAILNKCSQVPLRNLKGIRPCMIKY